MAEDYIDKMLKQAALQLQQTQQMAAMMQGPGAGRPPVGQQAQGEK